MDTELSEKISPHNTRSTDDSGRRLTYDPSNSADGVCTPLMMVLKCIDATLARPWSQQVGLQGGGKDMMDEDETPSRKRDTAQAPTVTEERHCKQSQMVETEPDTMLGWRWRERGKGAGRGRGGRWERRLGGKRGWAWRRWRRRGMRGRRRGGTYLGSGCR